MANYGMICGSMVSQDVKSKNRAGLVVGITAETKIPNGALVFADDTNSTPLAADIYGAAEISQEKFVQFTAGLTSAAYILDAAEVPQVTDVNGNTYKVGGILSNLEFAYDKALRYRKLEVEDLLYVFDGNITGSPAVGGHLVPTASSFQFTAQSNAATSGLDLRILDIEPLNAGLTNVGNKYLCKVVKL